MFTPDFTQPYFFNYYFGFWSFSSFQLFTYFWKFPDNWCLLIARPLVYFGKLLLHVVYLFSCLNELALHWTAFASFCSLFHENYVTMPSHRAKQDMLIDLPCHNNQGPGLNRLIQIYPAYQLLGDPKSILVIVSHLCEDPHFIFLGWENHHFLLWRVYLSYLTNLSHLMFKAFRISICSFKFGAAS